MTDRLVKVREQGKLTLRGLTSFADGARIDMDRDDLLTITVDWSHWLGGDTIASVANSANSANISAQSNTTTTAALTLAGQSGVIEHRVTTSSGQRKELHLYVNAGSSNMLSFD